MPKDAVLEEEEGRVYLTRSQHRKRRVRSKALQGKGRGTTTWGQGKGRRPHQRAKTNSSPLLPPQGYVSTFLHCYAYFVALVIFKSLCCKPYRL